MSSQSAHTNRLAAETSPYLLQHAHNPVDWYPWGPEALERARAEDKPILLSVGYSACHWCHVMERESFEDEATAVLMNRDFVCIKVDREERPDIDEVYMKAVQAFTGGRGGWPMTVFMTPTGEPYFGGTYFPPARAHGMPSFKEVLNHAVVTWRDKRQDVAGVTAQLSDYLERSGRLPGAEGELKDDWLQTIADAAEADFDPRNAGFGGAPKFPPHATLAALLAHWRLTGKKRSLQLCTRTLDAMAKGGMYDLLGGGFARYSVDAEWRVPHFEKMLYDNAQLVPVYLDAWKATGRDRYRTVVVETCDWALREMCHPEGGLCAAQDADSEGVEGKFFAWTPAELREVLGFSDGMAAAMLLQVTQEGTFEHDTSVLRLEQPRDELSDEDQALLSRVAPLLKARRDERVWPGRDDKVLTSWNAMMISALARAGATLGIPRYTEAAARAATFLLEELVDPSGRLLRTWKGGKAHILAFADDHALLVLAMLDLWEATFEGLWLTRANELADTLVGLFWDHEEGGLFFTGSDAEELITRSKHMLGGAEPSANGAAALAFARLAVLCGRQDLGDRADQILLRYQALLEKAPRALGLEAIAATWRTGRTQELAVVGPEAEALLDQWRQRYAPLSVVAWLPEAPAATPALLPWLDGRAPQGGRATAWLCEGFTCQLPTQDPAELGEQLDQALRPAQADRPVGFGRDRAPALPTDPALWLNTEVPLSLEALRGHVVVLDFWTSCCINCMHVLPELAALEAHFLGQPVVVLGVHSAKFDAERQPEAVAAAVSRLGVTHPVINDATHALWEQFTVKAWPTVMVLDTQGRIAWRQSGEVDRHTLIDVVAGLLEEGELAAAPAWTPPPPVAHTSPLRHPGKVHVFPGPAAQQVGNPAFGPDCRLTVADTGNHRLVEYALTLGADGWPEARELRSFGTGEAGFVDGESDQARFCAPQGMDRTDDTLWVADTGNHALRAVDLKTGAVRTVAGTGTLGRGEQVDPRRPRSFPLRSPWDVAVASEGTGAATQQGDLVFIAMAGTHQLWVYLPEGDRLTPVAGSGQEDHVDGAAMEAALAQPSGLELYGRYLFFADSETSSIRALDLVEHTVGSVAGQGLFDFGDVDGKGAEVRMQHPMGLTAGDHFLYVADTMNDKIKVIDLSEGTTATLAGGPGSGHFHGPAGITRAGDFLLVADTDGHRVQVVHRVTGEVREL